MNGRILPTQETGTRKNRVDKKGSVIPLLKVLRVQPLHGIFEAVTSA
jgi:hypothetical protein